MDTNTSILLFNLILNIIVVLDHLILRLKKSSCMGNTIEMRDEKVDCKNNNDDKDQKKDIV